MRVCIATPDFPGPIRNGGVGTALLGLAEALRNAGHAVSVLYASELFEQGSEAHWREHYAAEEIDFSVLPALPDNQDTFPDVARSIRVYERLRKGFHDIVHFPDYGGVGFHTAQAAALGLLARETAIVTSLNGPSVWGRSFNHSPVRSIETLVRDALERGTVEYADAVISPSRYMLDWAIARNWSLPTSHHAFYSLPAARAAESQRIRSDTVDFGSSPLELVFFGRLEQRKGCHLFIDTVNALLDRGAAARLEVTFLGKFNELTFPPRILGLRTRDWPIRWRVIDGLGSSEALAYLCASANRLAIMPSLGDNSPCVVTECLLRGIPFLACDVGGIFELIAEDHRSRILVPPTSFALADAIEAVIRDGFTTSDVVETPETAAQRQVKLHEEILRSKRRATQGPASGARVASAPSSGNASLASPSISQPEHNPLISVCLVHRNRWELLEQALRGYAEQEFRDFEVIVADNGSKDAGEQLRALRTRASYAFPVRVVDLGRNLFQEGGFNAAARLARGAWLKFHDDDNVPKPHELRVFADAMASGRASAISCALDVFSGNAYPTTETPIIKRITFVGDGGSAAYLQNVMGDTNFIVDRAVFEVVGGFTEEGHLLHAQDWRFLAKLKAKGYRVASLPDALVWYRRDPFADQMNWRRTDVPGSRARALTELAGSADEEIRQLILLAQSPN
jgi:glycosyltransferase involved in cell wall biosynthesis